MLGALDAKTGALTPTGSLMARMPLEPSYARALLAARAHDCVGPMLTLTAVMSVEGALFVRGGSGGAAGAGEVGARADGAAHDGGGGIAAAHSAADAARARFASQYGDVLTRVHAMGAAHAAGYNADWCRAHGLSKRTLASAERVRRQLCGLWARLVGPLAGAEREAAVLSEDERRGVRRALTAGFFARAAVRQPNGRYVALASREEVAVHPSSVLFSRKAPCVLFQELVLTTKRYIRELTVIDEAWLAELAPDFFDDDERA